MTAGDLPIRADQQPRPAGSVRLITASGLLAAGIVAWAAIPMAGAEAGARLALLAAVGCGILAVLQLVLSRLEPPEPAVFTPVLGQLAHRISAAVLAAPWPEGMLIATLALEALHRSRPWHTAVLGAALIAFLLAVHCAESGARLRVLRPQLPLLAAGAGLLVLAVGAAALPGLGTGPAAVLLRVLAAIAALVVGGLAVPL
jgi:hypothetical protein